MENFDVKKEFNSKYEEARERFGKRPNILVCGYTGSGKSSLVKAILGDVVPDSAIGDGAPRTMGYDCYENDLVKIWDSKGLELGETESKFTEQTRQFVRSQQENPNVDDHIHLVWYTIQGPGARITDCDKNLIKNIFTTKNVIVVVTKSDITRPNQKSALKEVIMKAGIPEERIIFSRDEEGGAVGCKELMNLSYAMLPDAYKDAFMEEGRDFTSEDIARGVPFVKKFFAERAIACREDPIKEERIEEQIAIFFNKNIAIVSLPAEPFIEIGEAIRKDSPYPMTILAALGQGEVGYVGLPRHYGNGGYETSPSRGLADRHVGETMIEGALKLLK